MGPRDHVFDGGGEHPYGKQCSNYQGDRGIPPTAVGSPCTLQWAALGVIPHYFFVSSATDGNGQFGKPDSYVTVR